MESNQSDPATPPNELAASLAGFERPSRRFLADDGFDDCKVVQLYPLGEVMDEGAEFSPLLDGYLMALNLVENVEGRKRGHYDETLRGILREIAEGRRTLIDDEILRRGKNSPFMAGFIEEERRKASQILEGLEALDQ